MTASEWLTITGLLVTLALGLFTGILAWNGWVTSRLVAIEDRWKQDVDERMRIADEMAERHEKYLKNIKAALKEKGIIVKSPRDTDSPIHIGDIA